MNFTSFVLKESVWFLDFTIPSCPSIGLSLRSPDWTGLPFNKILSKSFKPDPFTNVAFDISPNSFKSFVPENVIVQSIAVNFPFSTIGVPKASI